MLSIRIVSLFNWTTGCRFFDAVNAMSNIYQQFLYWIENNSQLENSYLLYVCYIYQQRS